MNILIRSIYLLSMLAMVSILVTSCERDFVNDKQNGMQGENNSSTKLTNEIILASVNELNKFIEKNSLNNAISNENYVENLRQSAEKYTGSTLDFTTTDALKVKSVITDLFNEHDIEKALEHEWFPEDQKYLNLSIEIKETIVSKLDIVEDVNDIKFSLDEFREEILQRNLDKESLEFANLQIDITQNLLINAYKNIVNKKGVSCNFFQWICVGSSTAAAIALIAVGGAGAIAIIAGGGTVATVAACCICGCACTFTDSCQESEQQIYERRVELYEGANATQDIVGIIDISSDINVRFKSNSCCVNDEARSMRIFNMRAGQNIAIYDNSDPNLSNFSCGDTKDDWLCITALRDIEFKQINTFEPNPRNSGILINDGDVIAIYGNGGNLNGKVSRLVVQ